MNGASTPSRNDVSTPPLTSTKASSSLFGIENDDVITADYSFIDRDLPDLDDDIIGGDDDDDDAFLFDDIIRFFVCATYFFQHSSG